MAAITPVVEKKSIVTRRDVSKEEVVTFGTIDIISLQKKSENILFAELET